MEDSRGEDGEDDQDRRADVGTVIECYGPPADILHRKPAPQHQRGARDALGHHTVDVLFHLGGRVDQSGANKQKRYL